MSCARSQQRRVELAAGILQSLPHVIAAEPLAPSADPTSDWTLELTLDADRCPPIVLEILGNHGLGTLDQNPQGGLHKIEAVAD